MSDLFKDFQSFADWHSKQVGYGQSNWHLDKDILKTGNTVYSEDTCVLVPAALNCFFTDRAAARGKFPQGVSQQKGSKSFIVIFTENGEKRYYGSFKTVTEASLAYKAGKEAAAYNWYKRLVEQEYSVDPRVIERMKNYTFVEGLTNGS